MRNLVIFGGTGQSPSGPSLQRATIDGQTLTCGVIETPAPAFDPSAAGSEEQVLARVRTFSCNFRDRNFITRMATFPGNRHRTLGSEFAAEVVAVGAKVQSLRPGDRVVPNHNYFGGSITNVRRRQGVVTNHASSEFQVIHHEQLIRVPDTMPLEEAAAFSLGAQTAYGMVRRLDIKPGDPVLVTSATSNTSLFLIAALRRRGATIFATTTSDRFHPAIKAMGVERVHAIGSHPDRFPHVNEVLREAFRLDGFTAVLDPFFDLHLELAVEMLKPFGQYITCGMAGQSPHLAAEVGKLELDPIAIVQKAIVRNLSIIGNCLGLRSDLEQALSDYAAGAKAPPIDSVFSGHQAQQFLHRTFMDRQRFGKVVFQYQ